MVRTFLNCLSNVVSFRFRTNLSGRTWDIEKKCTSTSTRIIRNCFDCWNAALLTHCLRAIGALVVTVPSVWYVLQPAEPHGGGGHSSHGHEEHSEQSHEEKAEDEGKEGSDDSKEEKSDESSDSPAKKNPKGPDDKGVSSDSADEGMSNPDTSQDSGKSKKGEGTADTAKVKGTAKPDGPTVCELQYSSLLSVFANSFQPEQTNKSDKNE